MEYSILLSIQYASILLIAIVTQYVFVKWTNRRHSYLFLYCMATLVNNLGYLMEMTATNSDAALKGTQVSYLGKVFIPLALFIIIMDVCGVKISSTLASWLSAFHLLIFVMVLTCKRHKWYYTGIQYTEEGLFPHNEFGHGIFYFIYMFLMFGYIIFGVIVLIKTIRKEKSHENKIIQMYFLGCVLVEAAGFGIFMTGLTAGYDITAFAYAIATVFMCILIIKHDLLSVLDLVRDFVVDNIAEGIIAVDYDGKVVFYNDQVKRVYPEIAANPEAVVDDLEEKLASKQHIENNDRIFEPDEDILVRNGVSRGKIYELADITDSYNFAMQLKQQKEIAENANESKSAFLSIVSHEIRTPMNAVVGMTDLLLRDGEELNEKQKNYLNNIKNSGASLVMIVNDILDQSKIEAGKMQIVDDVYDLREVTDNIRLIIENRIGSKPVRLIYNIDEKIPVKLIGDGLRIRQILINLMNNAVKFTSAGNICLSISVCDERKDKKALRFSIVDTGQGIRKEDLQHLGEAFTQVDIKKNHSKEGTGLGLSISRDFISMMGGQLEVTSEYGKGTEFFFTIWQGIPTGDEIEHVDENTDFTIPGVNILVVDDNDINLMIAEDLLEPLNAEVSVCNNGNDAIRMVREKKYDLIFIDYMMPGMNGVEATENIRKLADESEDSNMKEYFKNVPIVSLSGDTSSSTREKFIKAGINDWMDKPVDIIKLKTAVLKWVSEDKVKV